MTIRNRFDLLKIRARRSEGQTMAEYGVVLAVITVGILLALGALATGITGTLGDVTQTLKGAIPTP
jgi:Flp pilus assembly pilin Flp